MKRQALEVENKTLKARLSDWAVKSETENSQISSLKQTILQQKEDIKVYQQNERIYKQKLASPQKLTVKRPDTFLPMYEPETKPEPIAFSPKPMEMPLKIDDLLFNTSPDRESKAEEIFGDTLRNSTEMFSPHDRAGVKVQKHCTIDCVFSMNGCVNCRDKYKPSGPLRR